MTILISSMGNRDRTRVSNKTIKNINKKMLYQTL